ncbi:hypothetical protein N7530_008891 [Penicillium desertorum]|uniref:Uncharacterized protein n=1 Tax=Penicillium desertorum TaxID=1303715 RepID=A0A9X0BLF0_9EURO|nr:hypothetical protein N7530_008891 [Penicillium desertorum]
MLPLIQTENAKHGDFDPRYYEASQPPYQNFTVKVPKLIAAGNAQINVAHAALVGAATFPYLESMNRTVVVI